MRSEIVPPPGSNVLSTPESQPSMTTVVVPFRTNDQLPGGVSHVSPPLNERPKTSTECFPAHTQSSSKSLVVSLTIVNQYLVPPERLTPAKFAVYVKRSFTRTPVPVSVRTTFSRSI